ERREHFVGRPPGEVALVCAEDELAAARRDVDIAFAAENRIRLDGDLPVGGKGNAAVPVEQPPYGVPIEKAEHRRMRGDDARERERRGPARRRGLCRRE